MISRAENIRAAGILQANEGLRILMSQLKLCVISFLVSCFFCSAAFAQSTTFTYQGKLSDGGSPPTGTYDLQFKLYDALTDGSLQGSPNTITKPDVQVNAGNFTVQLDFGANAFPGPARFLDIGVKRPVESSFTPLSPRQPITSTPYAVRSLSAETIFIGSDRVLNVSGTVAIPNSNTFLGVGAGINNMPGGSPDTPSGSFNSFFGERAGSRNTQGNYNSFFGSTAGFANTQGFEISFFGRGAGFNNRLGNYNCAIGASAELSNP